MTDQDDAAARRFYDEQVELLNAGDIDRLVDTHYTPDAVLISFQNVVRGADALKEYYRGYMKMLGHLEVVSTDDFVAVPEGIFFTATANTDLGQSRVYDTWTLRDGKISHHFTGIFP